MDWFQPSLLSISAADGFSSQSRSHSRGLMRSGSIASLLLLFASAVLGYGSGNSQEDHCAADETGESSTSEDGERQWDEPQATDPSSIHNPSGNWRLEHLRRLPLLGWGRAEDVRAQVVAGDAGSPFQGQGMPSRNRALFLNPLIYLLWRDMKDARESRLPTFNRSDCLFYGVHADTKAQIYIECKAPIYWPDDCFGRSSSNA